MEANIAFNPLNDDIYLGFSAKNGKLWGGSTSTGFIWKLDKNLKNIAMMRFSWSTVYIRNLYVETTNMNLYCLDFSYNGGYIN
jgi:hypothetical protein